MNRKPPSTPPDALKEINRIVGEMEHILNACDEIAESLKSLIVYLGCRRYHPGTRKRGATHRPDTTRKDKPVTIENAARQLLDLFGPNGEHWCQGAAALDELGETINTLPDPSAKKFCLLGGLLQLGLYGDAFREFMEEAHDSGYHHLTQMNDHCEWAYMKDWLERIASGKKGLHHDKA